MARIFVSHSSRDNAPAKALGDWLSANGWDDVFLDFEPERGIAAGERWERALHEAADRCEAVVFLVSRNWLASEWCAREFDLARRLAKRLFGVLIDDLRPGDLPGRFTATWQFTDLCAGEDHEIVRVAAPPDGREAHVTFSRAGLARLKAGLTKAGLDPRWFAWPPEGEPDRAPYRGLAPLEAEDAGIFYGREAPLVQALDTLRALAERAAPRLFVVQGASGAGKSSFLRAGLLPRLSREDRLFRPLPVVRPAGAALHGSTGLVEALVRAFADARMPKARAEVRRLVEDPAALGAELTELARALTVPALPGEAEAPSPVLVLPVDQAEELFQADETGESAGFLRLLRGLIGHDARTEAGGTPLRAIVVATIRTDAYAQLQTAPALAGIAQQPFSLAPMLRGAFETVIEGPARRRTAATKTPLVVEPALTAALLADVERDAGPDALPLLAFTLERLYRDYGGRGKLTLADYERSGRLGGAIEAAVARALAAAVADPDVPKGAAARLAVLRRGLIPWLAGIDPATKEPRRRVARLSAIPQEARPLIELLVAVRLLTTDVTADEAREPVVEPAHESLLRQWGALRGWLEEDAGLLAALEGVLQAARDWDEAGRLEGWLAHTAGRLEDAEALSARSDLAARLGEVETAYLTACRAADNARRDREVADATRLAAALAEAEHANERARAVLRDATGAANRLVLDLAQRFRFSGVRARTLQAILDEAVALQDALAANFPDDPLLQRSRAVARLLLGDLYTSLENLALARAAYQDSLVTLRSLSESDRNDLKLQRDVSISLNRIGDVRQRTGDPKGALEAYEEALATIRPLSARCPEDTDWQRDVSVTLNRIGDVRLHVGDTEGALETYDEGLTIMRALAARDPENTDWQRDVSASLNRIGEARLRAGDTRGARAAFEEDLTIARALAARDRDNTQWQHDITLSLLRIGDMWLRADEGSRASEALHECLSLLRGLVARDPENTEWRRDLSICLNMIGHVRLRIGDPLQALAAYEEGLTTIRSLIACDPDNTWWQSDLIHSLRCIASVIDDAPTVRSTLEEALTIADRLAAAGALSAEKADLPDIIRAQLDAIDQRPQTPA